MCLIELILRKTNSYVKIAKTFLAKNVSKMRSYPKKLFAAKSVGEFYLQKHPFHKVEGVIFEI